MENKKALTFNVIDEIVTNTCSGLFADAPTKRKAQDTLMLIIAMACFEYQKNGELKRKIDAYWELRK